MLWLLLCRGGGVGGGGFKARGLLVEVLLPSGGFCWPGFVPYGLRPNVLYG